jgi:hypothetical protein
VRVGDVCPRRDVVYAAAVLGFHRGAYVGEFAVFEDEEVVGCGESGKARGEGGDRIGGGEGDDVDVGFCAAD